jgi:hypothetical protein
MDISFQKPLCGIFLYNTTQGAAMATIPMIFPQKNAKFLQKTG